MSSHANADRTRLSWATVKGGVPAWVWALSEACDRSSQGKVADRLGISAAVVNQVLGNSYKGRLDRIEQRVRGELMKATVACPVLGEISTRDCLDHQARASKPFRATNPLRVRLHQTCPNCPNREKPCSSGN